MRATSGDCPVGRLRNVSALNPSAPTDTHVHTAPHLTQLADVISHTEDCDYNPTREGRGGKGRSRAQPARRPQLAPQPGSCTGVKKGRRKTRLFKIKFLLNRKAARQGGHPPRTAAPPPPSAGLQGRGSGRRRDAPSRAEPSPLRPPPRPGGAGKALPRLARTAPAAPAPPAGSGSGALWLPAAPRSPSSSRVMRLSTFSSPSAILWPPDSVPGGERAGWRALHEGGGAGSGGHSDSGSPHPPPAVPGGRPASPAPSQLNGRTRPPLLPAPPPLLGSRQGACAGSPAAAARRPAVRRRGGPGGAGAERARPCPLLPGGLGWQRRRARTKGWKMSPGSGRVTPGSPLRLLAPHLCDLLVY